MDGVGEGIIGGNNLQPLRFKEDHADSACQRKQIDGDDRRAEDDGLLPLKKSPDSDAQPAAEQRAKRDDEEGAQPVEAFWSRPAEGRAPHQHGHPEDGCRDKTGQSLPNNDGPVTDGGEQEFFLVRFSHSRVAASPLVITPLTVISNMIVGSTAYWNNAMSFGRSGCSAMLTLMGLARPCAS